MVSRAVCFLSATGPRADVMGAHHARAPDPPLVMPWVEYWNDSIEKHKDTGRTG
jgi:hypothetical protein